MTTLIPLEIPADHPAFAGHFPGEPIVPGVVLLDESLEAVAAHLGVAMAGLTIVSAKFLSPARPGEPVLLEFERQGESRVRLDIRSTARALASALLELPPVRERG